LDKNEPVSREQFDEALKNLFIGCKECQEVECVHLQKANAYADQQDKRVVQLTDDNAVLNALKEHADKRVAELEKRMSREVAENVKAALMEVGRERISSSLGGDLYVNMADAMRIIDAHMEAADE
jgi:hypothetical protein